MEFTLKYLLESYKVMVPQIQRDYAQGRVSEVELRKGFVTKIKQTILDNELKLKLDFIYGYTEKAGKDEEFFIPLDGQQRLTTLWLTHWFLAPRIDNKLTAEAKVYLSNFTYETRVSSKRFCNSLIEQPLTIIDNISLSKQITDAPWFMASWSNDPTVLAMLNMLDTLHEEISEKSKAWENLMYKEKITFDFIDIKSDEFKLTDELYIKMNSRGKPLTPFENFKAQFSDLLASKDTDYLAAQRNYQNVTVTYQQYFAFNIDSVWMDLFWSYRGRTNYAIDESIYTFINFIAEFLFFKNNPVATSTDIKPGFDFLNKVFKVKENIDFLFNALDFLSALDDVSTFFETLFKDVLIFDNNSKDYFYRAITNIGFDVKDKTILYATLAYCINISLQNPDSELKDFIRIVRNLLLTVRQPNQSKRIEYTTNLRLPNVSDYCNFIDEFISNIKSDRTKPVYQILSENEFRGFSNENIGYEKVKATLIVANNKIKKYFHNLEDHSQIQGNTSNFKLSTTDISNKIDAFLNIWDNNIEDSLIIRAFLTIDDYSVRTHQKALFHEIWYFGSKGNWNRILTTTDKNERIKISDSLDLFLIEFIASKGNNTIEKLLNLIDSFNPVQINWRYYFVKYKSITDNSFNRFNLFTWKDEKGFDINSLGNSGNLPLHSFHLNPYLIILKKHYDSKHDVLLIYGRFGDVSFLSIRNRVIIKCVTDGWEISLFDKVCIDGVVKKMSLIMDNNNFKLVETSTKDRIEVAIEFIDEILK